MGARRGSTNPFDDDDEVPEEGLQALSMARARTIQRTNPFDASSDDGDISDDDDSDDDDLSFEDSKDYDDASFYEDCNQELEEDHHDDNDDGGGGNEAYGYGSSSARSLLTQIQTEGVNLIPHNSSPSSTRTLTSIHTHKHTSHYINGNQMSEAKPAKDRNHGHHKNNDAKVSEGTRVATNNKRVAPLSFDHVPVVANPALNVSRVLQAPRADFISPLETAMIGKVDHLKSQNSNDEYDDEHEEGRGDGEMDNQDQDVHINEKYDNGVKSKSLASGYLSVGWLRNLYSPKSATSTTYEDDPHANVIKVDETISDEKKDDAADQVNNDTTIHATNTVPKTPEKFHFDDVKSPLTEAKEVLERMDDVSNSIFRVLSAEKRNMSPIYKFKKKKPNRKLLQKTEENKRVLKRIQSYSKDIDFTIDHRQAGSPWHRLIILEELGTASSWVVLLLPYIAFILAMLLDADTGIWQTVSGPISVRHMCNEGALSSMVQTNSSFPLRPLPPHPCSYEYKLVNDEGLLSHFSTEMDAMEYMEHLSSGVAFTSGPLIDVPTLSTFLYGDVTYNSLSSSSVSLVADGLVEYSTILMQQRHGDDPSGDGEWFPVSISKPRKLSMICDRDDENEIESTIDTHSETDNIGRGEVPEPRWRCENPRNVDVLFDIMDTSFLTGGAVRIDTVLSYHKKVPDNITVQIPFATNFNYTTNITLPTGKSQVYSKHVEDKELLSHADRSNPDALIAELGQSASYKLTYPSTLKTKVLISARIGSFLLTIAFITFWFWCMGVKGFFACCCVPLSQNMSRHDTEQESMLKKPNEVPWWECPWMLFPERRYLLLLMISLLLVQNPVLIYMYFNPHLYNSPDMHMIADSVVGIGFHSLLCLWLCLCQGLRYHTASIARKRAEHQREILELRRAKLYQSTVNDGMVNGHYTSATDQVTSYYDEYGDVDGSWNSLRLKHDPCGDGWADFLIPKFCLFILGAWAVVVSSTLRFSSSIIHFETLRISLFDAFSAEECRKIFFFASLAHITIVGLWCVLILRAAIRTGNLLKKEPFLSTRPAQLAFRILMGILILGVLSFSVPIIVEAVSMITKWRHSKHLAKLYPSKEFNGLVYSSSSEYYVGKSNQTSIDVLINIMIHLTQRFPYSGSASSLGSGEIIYITACTLVVAFIFLPSTSYILDQDNHSSYGTIENGGKHQIDENQRRDKRNFLNLSRYTHTWRVFPLPIERHHSIINPQSKPKTVYGYQLDKNFGTYAANMGRGVIYERNYIPLFCVEAALWLLECSWQTYYSTTEYKTDSFAPGVMNLDTLGLDLEADIYDEGTDTRVFVASNIAPQIDGEGDSMIVIAFRGTASTTNLKTDFNWGQEALPKSFIDDQAEYQVHLSGNFDHEAGTSQASPTVIKTQDKNEGGLREGADALLRSAPITRQAFACIHTGFLHSYNQIRDEVFETVLEVYQRQLSKALARCSESDEILPFVLPKIYITGHSLGGALGQLLALDISRNIEIKIGDLPTLQQPPKHVRFHSTESNFTIKRTFSVDDSSSPTRSAKRKPPLARRKSFPPRRKNDEAIANESVDFVHGMLSGIAFAGPKTKPRSLRPPIAVYTFGQPRVGNRAFARFYKANVPHTFRVVAEGDAITMLPLATFFSGIAFYKHAGLDVILDEGSTGNILVGPTVVETLFRFSKVRTKVNNHLLEVYRSCLESAFTSEEIAEFYRSHGVNSRSIRSGYNVADVIPDWVTSARAREN